MALSFQYADCSAITRSLYFKKSKLEKSWDYSIENENWYTYYNTVSTSCVLINVDSIKNTKINFIKNEVSCGNKSIFSIDPFNIVNIDKPEVQNKCKEFKHFIYKTSPYLGI